MDTIETFLSSMQDENQRNTLKQVLDWVQTTFPKLESKIAWNQPMFTDHGTYIIGFSVFKNNFAVGPELVTLNHFRDEITKRGYTHTQQLIRFPWDQPIDFDLLDQIISYNIETKKDCKSFWRKA